MIALSPPVWVETSDRCSLAAYDFGGSGEPVLLAHATGFNAHVWLPVVERLRDRFHCYGFDQRGHGASPTPASDNFGWDRMGTDTVNVRDALGLPPCRAVGHSGGGAHLLLAEEETPGSWLRLWTFEPVVPPPSERLLLSGEAPNPLAEGAKRRRAWFESRQAAFDNYASKPPFDVFDPAALHAYVDAGFVDAADGGVTLACTGEDEARTYQGALTSGVEKRLSEVGIAVHVACGQDSTHFPLERMRPAADALPHSELEVMEGLGHFGPMQDPGRIADSIAKALG